MNVLNGLRRGCGAAAITTCILIPFAAFAHVFPQTQTPSAGAEVPAPENVTIVFDGPLEPAFSSLTVSNSTGKQVNTVKAQVDPNNKKAIHVAGFREGDADAVQFFKLPACVGGGQAGAPRGSDSLAELFLSFGHDEGCSASHRGRAAWWDADYHGSARRWHAAGWRGAETRAQNG